MSAAPLDAAASAPATATAGAAAQETGGPAATAAGGAPPLPNGGAGGAATDGGAPAPYPHQVGGHGAMVSMGGRLLKPLSRKELAFYTRLWDDAETGPALRWLRTVTPRFYGVYRPPTARGTAAGAVDAAAAAVAAVGLTPEAPPGGVNAARAAAAAAAAAEASKAAVGGASPVSAAAAAASAAYVAASAGGRLSAEQNAAAATAASTAATSAATAAAHDETVSAAATAVPATPPTPRVPLTWDSDVAAMASSAMASSANPDVASGQLVDDSPAAREAAAAALAAAREEVELGPAARLRRAVRVATISPWAERMQALAARREAAAAAAAAAEAADAAASRTGRGGGGDDASDGGGAASVGGTSSSTSPRLVTTGAAAADVAPPSAATIAPDASAEQPPRVPRVSPDVDPTGSLVMEDLVANYTYPCIMDIKVGVRHYDDDASAEKRARHIRKAAATTSATVGIRVTGSQVYKATRGTLLFRDKYHGRRLREPQLAGELAHFFHDGASLRRRALAAIIARLKALLAHVEEQRTFNFYSSSILLIYEGDDSGAGAGRVPPSPPPTGNGHAGVAVDDESAPTAPPVHTDVRMIDFAHTQPSRGAMDEGYALGLRNLVFLLETVFRDNTAPA